MLKIEKTKSGVTTTSNVNYTVTSNIVPKSSDINLSTMFYNYMIINEMTSTSGSSSYPPSMYMNNIFSRTPSPFTYGSIVLRDSTKRREIDIMSYFAHSDRSSFTDIVGKADMYNAQTGTNKLNGSLNVNESKTTTLNQNIHNFKRVFDFGTDKINDVEFDEILLMPCGFNSGVTSELTMTTDYSTTTSHKMLMKNPKIRQLYNNTTYTSRYAVDINGNMMIANPEGSFLYSENGIASTVNLIGLASADINYPGIAYIDGQFTIFKNGMYGCGAISNTANSTYYKVDDITYNTETHKYDVTVSEPFSLPAIASKYVGGTYYIPFVWEWDGYVYMMVQRYSTSSSSNYINILKMDIGMTTILDSFSSYLTSPFSHSSTTAYYPSNIIYDKYRDTVIITKYGSKLFELNKDLTYTTHAYSFPTAAMENLCRFPHNEKLWGVIRANLPYVINSEINNRFIYGEVNTLWNSIMSIKLDEPISKTSGETLKITLDVTMTNGDIQA